jgi:glyoxylase-like metal-dependent hydrolase (beta-lactamase superfamily II)
MNTDGYAGDVTPGGPTDVRELPRLTIRKCSVSSMNNNAYLLTCRSSGAQLLVDAADEPRRLLAHGDTVRFGDVTLDVVALRGHTPGSISLAYRDPQDPDGFTHLFTGDSLFPGGVGNTKNPGQSFDSLYRDVTERVFDVYADDTWVYPGHGGDTTLGVERPHLDEWRARGW